MMNPVGLENAVAILGPIAWHQFGVIQRFCIQHAPDNDCDLEVTLASEGRTPAGWVAVRFEGVRKLKLQNDLEGGLRILGLDVVTIADRQWQKLAWEVLDFENDCLRFYCRAVVIISAGLV